MKSLVKYGIVFILGLGVGIFYLWKSKQDYQTEQVDVITQGIKNVRKIVVTEASFSEIYNYKDANFTFFETPFFEKRVILLVNARIQVAYDLEKMVFYTDESNKKLIIKSIPEAEITLIPSYKYYDIQQSVLNAFTKEELNKIQKNSREKLLQTAAVSEVKEKAHDRLIEELENLLSITNAAGWRIEDQTQNQIFYSFEKKLLH